jgi:methionyl-tRNA formyltransferase
MSKPLRIVFMGTPAFAVPSLRMLLEHGYEVCAVVTATDKPGGRGKQQLIQSAVKQYAEEQGLAVLQPEKMRDPEFLSQLEALHADIYVVVAFRMLPELVWRMPRLGTFNLHGSLLPKYRGAAPINWAVIRGEQETGVTTFFLQAAIDTGDIILQKTMPVGPDETAGEVHDRMMALGAGAVLETVQLIEKQQYYLRKQDDTAACPAPKIFHETSRIDFSQTCGEVHNFIRGLSPYPGAWTLLDGLELKITRSRPVNEQAPVPAGQFFTDHKKWLRIACAEGSIEVLELQLQGRKRLGVEDFLKGYRFSLSS